MPLAVEMPAPVNTRIRRAERNKSVISIAGPIM
jgi:hypothetical protein